MARRLFLIDGHALIFKMYYAFLRRPMINSAGTDTSILFGFTKYILELIEREKPTHLAVAFDPPGGTFRNEMYPLYKANRAETPQLVIDALQPLMDICSALNIKTYLVKGYEADDVIGTVAVKCASADTDVYMVTPDKDYGQLIDTHIFQYKPGKSGSECEILDSAAVCQKYGIQSPSQVIEMLAICGDTADNVPGVKGVGEVGASKLISKYGSLDGIYDHIGELTQRQRQQFEDARGHIGLSHQLVVIKTDVPVESDLATMAYTGTCKAEAVNLFRQYEFNSLKKYLSPEEAVEPSGNDRKLCITETGVSEIIQEAARTGKCALGGSAEALTAAVPAGEDLSFRICHADARSLAPILTSDNIVKYGFDLKSLINNVPDIKGLLMDASLLHYILDPEKNHGAISLAKGILGIDIEENNESEDMPLSLFDVADAGNELEDNKIAAAIPIADNIMPILKDQGLDNLYLNMEEPLVRVLSEMEKCGVKLDISSLTEFANGLKKELAERESAIYQMAGGTTFNISSPKQVGQLLFEKLKLAPKAKKTANGTYSTDEATLLAIQDKHPIIGEILEYRAVKKLLSTYIEPFPTYISPATGKIHTTFNQALTATGRLSSSNPNLQNIPIRTERGKEIRKAFVPSDPDGFIVSADYSQIELRIMAHLSGDEHMLKAFRDGQDIHASTASKIYGIPCEEVTREQRAKAKTANFGIIYGISAFGLAQRLNISRTEAKELIDGYFEAFPCIRDFIAQTLESARSKGYVETIFGRRRYIPDINAGNANVRALAERNAINAPIQGTSADIIKMAMIKVDSRIRQEGLKSRMVLQIHDELVFDTAPDEKFALMHIAKEEMESVARLTVPLTTECNYGKNWLEAH